MVGLLKTRASLGTFGIVSNGDTLGQINFAGDNGVDYSSLGAQIVASVDGVPSSTSMAGRLVFSTTPSASITPQERVRIDSSGNVGIGTTSPAVKLDVVGAITASSTITANGNLKVVDSANDFGTIQLGTATTYKFTGGATFSGFRFEVPSGTNQYDFQQGGTTRALINANGIGIGATTPTSGIGIKFPATQSASSDANTLDDYEEGTWTAGFSFGNGTTGITYANQAGFYTKVGNMVNVTCQAELSNKGSSTGIARITGLPFTIVNNIGNDAAGAIRFGNITYLGMMVAMGGRNTTIVALEQVEITGNRSTLSDTNFSNSSFVILNLTYRV
jgi:hypothetical protein